MNDQRAVERNAEMDRVVAGLSTKSDKIRALGRAGYARADIARYLGIRYQHVRNVLVASEKKAETGSEVGTGGRRRQEWAQVGPDGRVVIPAPYRRLLGIEGGGPILLLCEDGELRLVGRNAAVRRAQDLVARHVPAGTSLAAELIAERRAEAARESDSESSRS